MKKISIYLIMLLLSLVIVTSVHAESELANYINRLRNHNPELLAAKYRQKASRYGIKAAAPFPDPSIEIGVPLNDKKRVSEISLSQPIPWPSQLTHRTAVARLQSSSFDHLVKDLENELLFKLRVVYADLYSIGERIKLHRENLAILKQAEELTRTHYTIGKRTQTDLLKLQLEYAVSEDKIAQLQTDGERIRDLLGELVVLPTESITYPPQLPTLSVPDSLKSVLAIAVDMNPLVKSYEKQVETAAKRVQLARSGLAPGFMTKVQYIPKESFTNGNWSLMAGVTLPLWYRSKVAGVAQSKALVQAQRAVLTAEKNSLHAETATMFRSYSDAQRQLTLLDKVLIPLATQSLSVTETAYSSGQVDVLNFIDAQRALITLRIQWIEQLVRREKMAADIVICCLGNAQ